MFYVDPDFMTREAFDRWFESGKIVHVHSYTVNTIKPGPATVEVVGPRPPQTPSWIARVEYDEQNVIKKVLTD